MRIDQLLPAAHPGDATGDAARALAGALRRAGHQADIYALDVDPPLRSVVRPFRDFPSPGPGDVTVLHFTLPSPLSQTLASCSGHRVLVYHNLTPPELLLPHCPEIARLTALGRRELRRLAAEGAVDLAIGVSRYNTGDLAAAGFPTTATLPLPLNFDRYDTEPDPLLAECLSGGGPTFLTVGRVAPNKRIEDFLKLAAYYLRYITPRARFVVVGSTSGLEAYARSLTGLHAALGLDQRVIFTGRVSLAELIAYYRAATAYVCTSAHEGFCVPLLEAMKFDLPILARRAAAIPETLGNAGILVDSEDPAEWAELLQLVSEDAGLRARLRQRGRERLASFDGDRVAARWRAALEALENPAVRAEETR